MVRGRLSVQDVEQAVFSLYDKAINELGFRPAQAFAYVIEEMEFSLNRQSIAMRFVWQVFICLGAIKYNLDMKRGDVYFDEFLEGLSDLYKGVTRHQLYDLSLADEEVDSIWAGSITVKQRYLSGR